MTDPNEARTGVVTDVVENFSAVLRLLLPGVLLLGAAYAAHPSWFPSGYLKSWQDLTVCAILAVVAGNTLFVLNRYGLHQFIDFLAYALGIPGPARTSAMRYHADLAKHVQRSLTALDIPRFARQHISFRAGGVLLFYSLAEVALFFSFCPETGSFFDRNFLAMRLCGLILFVAGVWQHLITRRIDAEVFPTASA
jgi:hypothetical protein